MHDPQCDRVNQPACHVHSGRHVRQRDPSIPELEDHQKVFQLLPAARTVLGMDLSPAYQLLPEESTAAIIVHHSRARYFSVGESRVEQLMR